MGELWGLSPAFIIYLGRAAWAEMLENSSDVTGQQPGIRQCGHNHCFSSASWEQGWGWVETSNLRPCHMASVLGQTSEPPGGYSPCH